jgi:hypothetical protein
VITHAASPRAGAQAACAARLLSLGVLIGSFRVAHAAAEPRDPQTRGQDEVCDPARGHSGGHPRGEAIMDLVGHSEHPDTH